MDNVYSNFNELHMKSHQKVPGLTS